MDTVRICRLPVRVVDISTAGGLPSQNRIPPVSAAKRKRRPSELIDPSELLALAEIDAEAALAALDVLS